MQLLSFWRKNNFFLFIEILDKEKIWNMQLIITILTLRKTLRGASGVKMWTTKS